MKILLVEDDERITACVEEALTDQNYVVDVALDGEAGWEYIQAFSYDVILLDVMLPKLDGISLCQRLRHQGYQIPVLMLTARDTTIDKVEGLDAGADDYLVKPFNIQELSARIRAVVRRGNFLFPPVLEVGDLRLDPNSYEVTYAEERLPLTPKEFRLLELFLRNSNRVLSRSIILEHLWSFRNPPGEETVKVHIKDLRQKLKAAGAPADMIETVYGLGYRLKEHS